MTIDLTGQHALVTGASRGIGRAVAQALGLSGARVAVHYHRQKEPAGALASKIDGEAFQADLSDTAACERLFSNVIGSFGRLDVLVNNAGLFLPMPLRMPRPEWQKEYDRLMAVNLRAPELLCRLALRHFCERSTDSSSKSSSGRIINIASRAAFRGDAPDYTAYAASKGGLVALTRSIARGYGKQGVRAFVLAPGFTRTDMVEPYIEANGEQPILDEIALERMTEPEDLAPLAVLLASGRADHATGTTIDVNAGSYVH